MIATIHTFLDEFIQNIDVINSRIQSHLEKLGISEEKTGLNERIRTETHLLEKQREVLHQLTINYENAKKLNSLK